MVGLVANGPKKAVSLGTIHVAVIYGACCVHLVVAASDRTGLQRQLADYVNRQANVQLFGGDAERVHGLLDKEALEEAVQLYFARVGERWDQEWLEETIVELRE